MGLFRQPAASKGTFLTRLTYKTFTIPLIKVCARDQRMAHWNAR